jgi:hypothetical protein
MWDVPLFFVALIFQINASLSLHSKTHTGMLKSENDDILG